MGQIACKCFDFLVTRLRGGFILDGSQEERERELHETEQYNDQLKISEAELDERISNNACPSAGPENFQVLGFLKEGGFGKVYKVTETREKKDFALKVQPKFLFTTRDTKEMAVFEKQLTFALRHVFVIELYYAFRDAYNLYMVLEYAKYGEFSQLTKKNVPEQTSKLYAAQIVLGIEYLHACNIVHRDLKPKNIFVVDDYYIKIGDFGTAKKVTERTYTGVGTPEYMAPEVDGNVAIRKAIDWWSFGVLLYELVYDGNPFCNPKADNTETIRRKIKTYEPKFDYLYETDPVSDLIRGLLEKKPDKRIGAMEGGTRDVKTHVWFKDISFMNVLQKRVNINVHLEPVQEEPAKGSPFPAQQIAFNPDDGFEGF